MTTRALSRRIFAALIVLAGFLGTGIEARAEKKVPFSKIVDPADVTEAARYWRGELEPDAYDNARDFGYPNSPWPVTKTIEDYIRHYIRIGRADLDDDGIDELFYLHEDTRFCGSIGCPMLVFEKKGGAWVEICGTSGGKFTEITDYVTEGGGNYREMEARYRIFWQDGECHLDSPERLEYHPPPPGRIWKPIR